MSDETTALDLLLMDEEALRQELADDDAETVEAKMIEVQNLADLLNENRKALARIYEEKAAQRDAARKYANLSDAEKAALAQYLKVDGIDGRSQLGSL